MSFYTRRRLNPVLRQLILRTAVMNYLIKELKRQWNDWQTQQLEAADGADMEQKLATLRHKVGGAHALLTREYADFSVYIIDHLNVWNSPEYDKATSALGIANRTLKLHLLEEQTIDIM